ncbi:MAG: hypothetical protein IT550_04415 [Novosphingobium sp.]|nr:hypothetical protein [Novosphingobium sp.]
MVASRFENSLFSRPWMAQTGVYPGQPAATPQQAATPASAQPNAPLQIMAGSLPAAQPAFQPQGQGEGYGGGGMDPNATGYGVSPSLGAFATSVLSNLGPFGMAATLATMMADPTRATPYGIGDLFGGGQMAGTDPSLPSDAGIDAYAGALAPGLGINQPTGLGLSGNWGAGFSPEVQAAIDSMNGGGGNAGGATSGGDLGAGTASETGALGGVYQRGGYTGAGQDGVVQPGMPAGTVHEGEQVINARSTRKYGTENLAPLNEGKVPRNKLVALAKRYR